MGVSDFSIYSIERNPPIGPYVMLDWTCNDASSVTIFFGPSEATAGEYLSLPTSWLYVSGCTSCGNIGFNLPEAWMGETLYAFLYVTGGASAGTSNVDSAAIMDAPISDLAVSMNSLQANPDYVILTWTPNSEVLDSLYYGYTTTNPGDLSAATYNDLVALGITLSSVPTDWTNVGFNLGNDYATSTTYYFVLCSIFVPAAEECSNVISATSERGWNAWLVPPARAMKKKRKR
jgi:hypothetical protein